MGLKVRMKTHSAIIGRFTTASLCILARKKQVARNVIALLKMTTPVPIVFRNTVPCDVGPALHSRLLFPAPGVL